MQTAERELEAELEQELESELAWAGAAGSASEGEFEGEGEWESEDEVLYEVIRRDTRVLVRNTTAIPFRFICHLECNGRAWGAGTLIGTRTVLTAGHCLDGQSPSRMRIIPGRNGTLEPLPATLAAAFRIAPAYRAVTSTDYGIIHLRDPIGSNVGFWSRTYQRRAGDESGTSISAGPLPLRAGVLRVNLSGYPGDKSITIGRPPRRIIGTQQFRAYDRSVQLRDGMLHYLNDTFPGHSGSPVWVRRHPSMGGRVLIAIHVGGDDPSIPGRANRAVKITPAILSFVVANTI